MNECLYAEEVKVNTIIRTVCSYRFYCPECGRRIRTNGVRKYNDTCKYIRFMKCECGYDPEPEVVG